MAGIASMNEEHAVGGGHYNTVLVYDITKVGLQAILTGSEFAPLYENPGWRRSIIFGGAISLETCVKERRSLTENEKNHLMRFFSIMVLILIRLNISSWSREIITRGKMF